MKVLIIVDLQNDFCPGGGLAVAGGNEIVGLANKLLKSPSFDLRVATMDWHPKEHTCFAVNHLKAKVFSVVEIDGVKQTLWPVHCVQDTKGAELHADLDLKSIDYIQKKGAGELDSYSGFFENDRATHTGLYDYLVKQAAMRGESASAIEVVVCGLALDYCVAYTALDAAKLGFKTSVVLDATRAIDNSVEGTKQLVQDFTASGIELIESREILQELDIQCSKVVNVALSL